MDKCYKKARESIMLHCLMEQDSTFYNDPHFLESCEEALAELSDYYKRYYCYNTNIFCEPISTEQSSMAVVQISRNGYLPGTVNKNDYRLNSVLMVMARVLAYFSLSVTCTLRHINLIRVQFVEGLLKEITDGLSRELGLEGEESDYYVEQYSFETPERIEKHKKLEKEKEILTKLGKELRGLQRVKNF